MAGKMASILALSLLLAMQIGDVQATHCPPSGCPVDVTDDVEFIQRRVNVETPFEKVKADKGGDTTEGTPSCLLRSLHHLCFNFDGANSSKCHSDPKSFLEAQFAQYVPSGQEMATRQLMMANNITKVSVGAHKKKICNDVIPQATMCTDRAELDLFQINSWISLVQSTKDEHGHGGFDVIFSEHVLEHFGPTQVEKIAAVSYAVLKPGGVFRIAVPDGYKPSPSYQLYVRAGGTPSGAGQNHMVAWTVDTLPAIFQQVGFDIIKREHFTVDGTFHSDEDAYNEDHVYGIILRSGKHDPRNKNPFANVSSIGQLSEGDLRPGEPMFTSLWFDAVKPTSCHELLAA